MPYRNWGTTLDWAFRLRFIRNHFHSFRESPRMHNSTLVKLGLRKEKDTLLTGKYLAFRKTTKGENRNEQLYVSASTTTSLFLILHRKSFPSLPQVSTHAKFDFGQTRVTERKRHSPIREVTYFPENVQRREVQ